MSNVWEYGCWCYFQEDHGRGRGQPQNEMDSICQVLHHGYTCIIMDAIAEGIDCDPFTHGYTTIQVLGNSNQELEVDCHTANRKYDQTEDKTVAGKGGRSDEGRTRA